MGDLWPVWWETGGWFCRMSGGQNHIQSSMTPVINPPDLHELWVLDFHFINNLAFLGFLLVFMFSCRFRQFNSVITRCDRSLRTLMVFTDSSQTRSQQEELNVPSDCKCKTTLKSMFHCLNWPKTDHKFNPKIIYSCWWEVWSLVEIQWYVNTRPWITAKKHKCRRTSDISKWD